MKKTLKAQLFAAVSMLVVAAVALSGATYAWFTAVANPIVKNLDLYVKAADSMFLSELVAPVLTQDGDWSATITKDMITAEQGATVFPSELINVSNVFNSTHSTFYGATHDALGELEGFVAEDATGGTNNLTGTADRAYVKFNLWVKSTNDGFVYLEKDSLVKALDGWLAAAAPSPNYLTTAPGMHIQDTVRVGFVPLDYAKAGPTLNTSAGARAGAAEWADAVIWEPNSTEHLPITYSGLAVLPVGKQPMLAVNGILKTDTTAQTAFDFITGGTNCPASGYAVGGGTKTIDNPDDKIFLFNMGKDKMQQFAVYIWVEGQDVDTVNAVAKNYFLTNLKFGQETGAAVGATYDFGA